MKKEIVENNDEEAIDSVLRDQGRAWPISCWRPWASVSLPSLFGRG